MGTPSAEARDRRTYRLALLLTGRADAAAQVAEDVAEASMTRRRSTPRRGGTPPDRTDRLTVLAARQRLDMPRPRSAGTSADAGPGRGVAEALATIAGLRDQPREAWIFVRVFGQSLREAAIAMDCSRSAVRRHLRRGDAQAAIAGGAHPSEVDGPAGSAGVATASGSPGSSADPPPGTPPPTPHHANAALIERVRQAMAGARVPESVLASAGRAAARPGRRRMVRIALLLLLGAGVIVAALLAGRELIDRILALVGGGA
ncbi:MAG: sigma factor-like helix-turn-helix DNA-binding protein [Phycisphaerales bacterium]